MLVPLSYLSFVRSSSIIYSRQNKEESEVNRGWKSQEVKELRINTGLTTIWFPLTNYESRTIYFYMIHLHCFSTEDKQWGPALCILTLNTTNKQVLSLCWYFRCICVFYQGLNANTEKNGFWHYSFKEIKITLIVFDN